MNLANEGLEAKRKEEETMQKKRKAEDDKTWEGAQTSSNNYTFNFTSMVEQKAGKTGLAAGGHSLPPPRRRKRASQIFWVNIRFVYLLLQKLNIFYCYKVTQVFNKGCNTLINDNDICMSV